MRPREYTPGDDDVIYHYCGAQSFHTICTNKTLRFGDLHAMNDYAERHWGYSIWEEAASGLLGSVGKAFLDEIDHVLHSSGFLGLILASCFSKKSDVLSQWRAYADDGAGYAIGFSAKELAQLPVSLLEVLYDRHHQVREMTALIRALHKVEENEPTKRGSDFVQACHLMSTDMAAYKNPAFSEEEEIRLVHLLDIVPTDHGAKFEDAGGTAFGQEVAGQGVQFRVIGGVPSPFIDLGFLNREGCNPIKSVVLGPKNHAVPAGVMLYLETVGLSGVEIARSEASYQ